MYLLQGKVHHVFSKAWLFMYLLQGILCILDKSDAIYVLITRFTMYLVKRGYLCTYYKVNYVFSEHYRCPMSTVQSH